MKIHGNDSGSKIMHSNSQMDRMISNWNYMGHTCNSSQEVNIHI